MRRFFLVLAMMTIALPLQAQVSALGDGIPRVVAPTGPAPNIHTYRQIFMDGRKHPVDLDPTWYGHSIGWWEGDTLAIDTVGFNDKFWFDFRGFPHTEQLHTVERWTRKDLGHLVNEVTIEDPGAYAKPFKATFAATLRPGEELLEYICQENNQDPAHLQGPARGGSSGF